MKKFALCLLVFALIFAVCGCAKSDGDNSVPSTDSENNPVVTMVIEGYGTVKAELYPEIAPETVNNFISLINSGFYNGNTIHRVAKDFVIQGGDPTGTGLGNPGYFIKGEFSANGVKNDLKHEKYVLSMARSSNGYDTAGCQFFIVTGEASFLDGKYAAFGRVIEGKEVVDKIASELWQKVSDYDSGKLIENLTITEMTVDTKGINYPEPTKIQ